MASLTGARLTRETSQQMAMARAVSRTQTQIATGRLIERASEDPVAAARIAELTRHVSEVESWSANLSLAQSISGQADSVLAQLSDRVVHAQELFVSGGNPSLGPADRTALARELRLVADDVEGLATVRNSVGQPLFASGATSPIPVGDGQIVTPAPNNADVFELSGVPLADYLRTAADALEIADPAARNAAYASALPLLEAITNHVADVRSIAGVQAARIEHLSERLANQRIDALAERSILADTDIAEAVAKLNTQQLTLEAAQAAFARIHRRTLFDILS